MQHQIEEEVEVVDLKKMSVLELDELAEQLFNQYFGQPHTPAERKTLMARYNEVANFRNKKTNFKAWITITPSTRIELKKKSEEDKAPALAPVVNLKKGTLPIGGSQPTGKIAEIIALFVSGKTKKEIIEAGYNKSTVNRQIGEYVKRTK